MFTQSFHNHTWRCNHATGTEREYGMGEFPTEAELLARLNQEDGITPAQEAIRCQPYYSSQNTYPPRYYQRIAINRTLDAIAKGQQRLLLVMATGTGKTYTAFQIVYRLLQSGMKQKILYLADRNILVDQSIQQDFAPLDKVIHKVNVAKDDKSTITTKVSAVREAITKNDVSLIKSAKDDLQKALYDVSAKLYQQAAPQGNPGQAGPDMGGAQPGADNGGNNNGNDGNVYDADFTDVNE